MNRSFLSYAIKFLALYALFYYGTTFYIGLTVKGGNYVPFLDQYLNFIDWYRSFLFGCSQKILSLFGYTTYVKHFTLRIVGANAVTMVWSCLGIGIISFWMAFVLANHGNKWFKLRWLLFGLIGITMCNIARIVVILIAFNRKWKSYWHLDHHDFYNIFVYAVVIVMILYYRKKLLKVYPATPA